MDRKRVILIVASLLAAFAFYTLYQNTIILWDGYALEVSEVTEVDPEYLVTLTPDDLQANPDVSEILTSVDGTVMITEMAPMNQLTDLVESKGQVLDFTPVYIQTDDNSYVVTFEMYGGMEDQPIYMYLAGLMVLVAIGLTIRK